MAAIPDAGTASVLVCFIQAGVSETGSYVYAWRSGPGVAEETYVGGGSPCTSLASRGRSSWAMAFEGIGVAARLFVASTPSNGDYVSLPTSAGFGRATTVLAISGGFIAVGYHKPGIAQTPPDFVLVWRLDQANRVVWSTLVPAHLAAGMRPHAAVDASRPTPVVLVADGAHEVTEVDLASGTIGATHPWTATSLVAGPHIVAALTLTGVGPVGQPPTQLGGYRALAVDAQDRMLIVRASPDLQVIDLYRLDDTLFDGVDGGSRRDPSFAPGGHVRLAPPSCPSCVMNGVAIAIDSAGALVIALGAEYVDPISGYRSSTSFIARVRLRGPLAAPAPEDGVPVSGYR